MNKFQALKIYHNFNKASQYIIGFNYKGIVYVYVCNALKPCWCSVCYSSVNNGHKAKVQLTLKAKHKEYMIRHNAFPLCTIDKLETNDNYNKGHNFEHMIYDNFGQTYVRDNVPFYVDSDITVNGVGYQVKFDGAQVAMYSTLKKLNRA